MRDWASRGLPKESDGNYDAPKCIRWRLLVERDRAQKALGELEAVKIAKHKAELSLPNSRRERFVASTLRLKRPKRRCLAKPMNPNSFGKLYRDGGPKR